MHNANTSDNTILTAQAEVEGLFVIELEERLEMAAANGDVITVRCV